MALEDYSAPDDSSDQTDPQPAAAPSPALQDFQSAFTHPDAQAWAGEVSTRLNDYFTRRQISDDNQRAGQNFVNDLDQFKSGLVKMVQADPNAVHTALDIVPPTLSGIIDTMPNAPEDAADHHAALTSHMQSEIAAAAVTSAAETHEGMARGILSDPRIQSVLGDSAGPLDTYIGMQAAARKRDADAAAGQQADAQAEIADQSGRNYLNALVDPNTGKPQSPDGWNQAIMADNRVPPQDKVALFNAHHQLGVNGDATTDPFTVMDMVGRLADGSATQRDLYPHVGASLAMADVGTLATAKLQPGFIQHLNDTIQEASQRFAPNGDIAETQALGRFVSWLMPQVRQGANVDPNHPEWVLGENGVNPNQFRVTGNDLSRPPPPAQRPSLGDIFGTGGRVQMAAGGETPAVPMIPNTPGANPLLPPRTNEQPIGGTESGSFFQRKAREMQQRGEKLNG